MAEPNQVEVTRRVVVEEKGDPVTRWLAWAAALLLLAVVTIGVYAVVSGVFTNTAPRTAEEQALAASAQAIRSNPQDGRAYALRAQTLFKLGRVDEAYEVLDQGEKAVGEAVPALPHILMTRTLLLNQEERYAEAEEVGMRAMNASDEYLEAQITAMVAKNLNPAGADSTLAVDTALQLATAYVGQEKWEDAIKLYSYALMYAPAAADILTLRGWAYVETSAETSAALDFNEALKYLPDDESALAGLEELGAK